MELLTWVKAWTAGTFACLAWATVEISLGRAAALTPILMPLLISLSLIVVLIYCVLIFKEAGKTKE